MTSLRPIAFRHDAEATSHASPILSHDTLIHRTLRPAIRVLARTPVTPDMLTVLRLTTGLGAASAFALGALAAGAGLFLVSILLDRADGELARQTRRFSRFGGRFDLLADCVSTMAAFVGLGIGAVPAWMTPAAGLVLGVVAAVSVAVVFAQLNMVVPAGPGRPNGRRPVDPDDVMLVVPVVIWCGGAVWILLASGTITPVVAIGLGLVWLTSSRRQERLNRTRATVDRAT